jgi:hypothetical protein
LASNGERKDKVPFPQKRTLDRMTRNLPGENGLLIILIGGILLWIVSVQRKVDK